MTDEKRRMDALAPGRTDSPDESASMELADASTRAALRAHFGDVPESDFDSLHARIVDAASLRLAARRKRAGWQAPASRWARIAIPTGLAASVALIIGLALGDTAGADPGEVGVEEVVAVAASDELPPDLLVSDQQSFLSAVLDGGE